MTSHLRESHSVERLPISNQAMAFHEFGVGSRKSHVPSVSSRASNFDYDAPIMIEDAQKERVEGFLRPTGGVAGDGPFEFILPPATDTYLLTGNLALYCVARVLREDGSEMVPGDVVAPINGLGTAMWEHTEVSLNDYVLSGASSTNTHYKSYIETVLSYDATSRDTHLRAQMFALDTPAHYEDFTALGANTGFRERRAVIENSSMFDMMYPVTNDFLRAHTHLAPGNKLSIKLYKARDGFLLCTNEDERYKIAIVDLKLFYFRVRLKESIPFPSIERYLTTRTELKRYPVPRGMSTYNFMLHHGGKMPKGIVLAQVATAAAEGSYSRNPFYFQHFGINSLCLRVNGRQVPSDPLTPNFRTDPPLVAREYTHMFMNTGLYRTDKGNCVTLRAFQNGITLFPFDLNPDMCNGHHLHESDIGDISVEISWSRALVAPITILVHCSYDEIYVHKRGSPEFNIEVI